MANFTSFDVWLKNNQSGNAVTISWEVLECVNHVPTNVLDSGTFSSDLLPTGSMGWHNIICSAEAVSGTEYCFSWGAEPTAGDGNTSVVHQAGNSPIVVGEAHGKTVRVNGSWVVYGNIYYNVKVYVDGVLNFYASPAGSFLNLNAWTDTPVRLFGTIVKPVISVEPEKPVVIYPEHEQTKVANGVSIPLVWSDGGYGEANAATSFDIYLDSGLGASDPDHLVAEDVYPEAADNIFEWYIPEDIHQQMGDISREYLGKGTEYFWRIVAKKDDEETDGDVWDFRTSLVKGLGAPYYPTPETEDEP